MSEPNTPDSTKKNDRQQTNSATEKTACFHATIRGRVQGIGFRYWTVETARDLGVNGWVRNLPDGNVDVEAEGERGLLETFVEHLKVGPALARVKDVDVDWSERLPKLKGFSVRY
jgi:acylphosphatase